MPTNFKDELSTSSKDEDATGILETMKKSSQEEEVDELFCWPPESDDLDGSWDFELHGDETCIKPLPDDQEVFGRLAKVSPSQTDSSLARDMMQLSMQDRGKILEDLHGVADEIKETPELIEKSLKGLGEELDKLEDKQAYDLAKSLDPDYVSNRDFLLRFLRCEWFDCPKAALRVARHFQIKLELFGSSKLVKDIVQDDLDPDDMKLLYSGYAQTLPVRDNSNRLVVFYTTNPNQAVTTEQTKLRRGFYMSMMLADETDAQVKGVVGVFYVIGQNFAPGFRRSPRAAAFHPKLWAATPIRISAIHCCYDSLIWLPIFSVIKLSASLLTRLRIRTHYGSQQECIVSLKSFGIPAHILPLSVTGEIQTKHHVERLEQRRKYERMLAYQRATAEGKTDTSSTEDKKNLVDASPLTQTLQRVGSPSRFDVLFGRGRSYQKHPGNIRYRKLIVDCFKLYEEGSREQKTRISCEIVDIVKQSTGRFLKGEGDSCWLEVSDDAARLKVAHTFRTIRPKMKNVPASVNSSGAVDYDDAPGRVEPPLSAKKMRRN